MINPVSCFVFVYVFVIPSRPSLLIPSRILILQLVCVCVCGLSRPSRLVFLFYNSSRGRIRPSPFVLSYGRSSYYNIVLVCLFVVDCCVVPCRHHRCRRRRRHRSVPIFFLFVRFIVITVATTATTVPISATIYCRYRCPNIIIIVDPIREWMASLRHREHLSRTIVVVVVVVVVCSTECCSCVAVVIPSYFWRNFVSCFCCCCWCFVYSSVVVTFSHV